MSLMSFPKILTVTRSLDGYSAKTLRSPKNHETSAEARDLSLNIFSSISLWLSGSLTCAAAL